MIKRFYHVFIIALICVMFFGQSVFAATSTKPSTSTTTRSTTTTKPSTSTTTKPSTSTTTKPSTSTTTKPSTSTTTKPSTSTSTKSTYSTPSTSGTYSSGSYYKPSTSGTYSYRTSTYSPYSGSRYVGSLPSDSSSYYYHPYNSWDSFWSHYWFYRALEPNNRTYVVDGTTSYAPAYTGFWSVVWDIISGLLVLAALYYLIRWLIRRKRY